MAVTAERPQIDSESVLNEARQVARTAASQSEVKSSELRQEYESLQRELDEISLDMAIAKDNAEFWQLRDRQKHVADRLAALRPLVSDGNSAQATEAVSQGAAAAPAGEVPTLANAETAFVEAQLEAPINPNERRGSEVFQKAGELARHLEAAGLEFATFRDPDGKHFTFAVQKPIETRRGRQRMEQLSSGQLIQELSEQYRYQNPNETPEEHQARQDQLVAAANTWGEFRNLVEAETVRNAGFYQEFERPRQGFLGKLKEQVGGWFQKKVQETRPARPEQPTKPETEKVNLVKEAKKGIDSIFAWGRKKIEESKAAKEAKLEAIRLEEMKRETEEYFTVQTAAQVADREAGLAKLAEVGTIDRTALDRLDLAVSAEKRLGKVKADIDRIAADEGAYSLRREKLQQKATETRSRIHLIEDLLTTLGMTSNRGKLEHTREIAQSELREADAEINILTRKLENSQRERNYLEATRAQTQQDLVELGRTTYTQNPSYNARGIPGEGLGQEIRPLRDQDGKPIITNLTAPVFGKIADRAQAQTITPLQQRALEQTRLAQEVSQAANTTPIDRLTPAKAAPEVAPLSPDDQTRLAALGVQRQTEDAFRQTAQVTEWHQQARRDRSERQDQASNQIDVTLPPTQVAGPSPTEPDHVVDVKA